MKKTICYGLVIWVVLFASAALYSQDKPGTQPAPKPEVKQEEPGKPEPWYEGENLRAIVGFEQSGASSAQSNQFFFTDLYFSQPFFFQPGKKAAGDILGPRLRMWGNIRITSVPQQVQSTVGDFVTDFYKEVGELKVNEVAQAIDFLIGLDYRLLDFQFSSANYCYSLNLIACFGAITPFNPKDYAEAYHVTPALENLYRNDDYDFTGKDYAVIVSPGRNRFFRQYYGGLRFKTFFNPGNGNGRVRFPAILDITYGVNESMTAGNRNKGIFRVDFFYPLNITGSLNIYLFGNAQLLATKTIIEPPLFLTPAPAGTDLTGSDVIMITGHPVLSEHYRIGIGLDLSGLFTPKTTH